ncbi:unnamed protein product [Musa acuminata var. zebrina]
MEGVADIVVVGAGIAGLAVALGLHRSGLRSLVLESSDSLRASGFAITTWTNAWRALDALGVGDALRQQHVRLEQLVAFSASSGSVTTRLSLRARGKHIGKHEVRCLKRNLLVEALAQELPHGTIRYSSKVVSVGEAGTVKLLHLADGSTLRAKVLIGCDGVNSVVAKWLGLKVPAFAGRYAARGIATFPDGHAINPEFAQHFGTGYRSGMLPCDKKSVYWFFTWTSDGEDKEMRKDAARVREFVLSKMKTAKVPEEVLHVIERSELSGVASSPLRYRSPLNLLWGDISRGNVCVTGDAFHPMTPDLGEGGCAALEDGVVLAKCLAQALIGAGQERSEEDERRRIEAALRKYANARRWRNLDLVVTSFVVGFIQEGGNWVMNMMRDEVLSGLLAKKLLSEADFECGNL